MPERQAEMPEALSLAMCVGNLAVEVAGLPEVGECGPEAGRGPYAEPDPVERYGFVAPVGDCVIDIARLAGARERVAWPTGPPLNHGKIQRRTRHGGRILKASGQCQGTPLDDLRFFPQAPGVQELRGCVGELDRMSVPLVI